MAAAFSTGFGGMMNWIRQRLGLECRITLPMALICFLICFIHAVLRNMKDSLVITAEGATAEVVPFIQLWMMLPATLLATWAFTRLANRYNQKHLFAIVIKAFLAFFAVFAFVLFPLRDFLHPHSLAIELMGKLPQGLHGFVSMFRNWTFSTFYTVSELWACMVTSVLFWSFANAITNLKEARRSYGLYAMGGNLGATSAGLVPLLTSGVSPEASVYILMALLVGSGITILTIFGWLTKNVLIGAQYSCIHQNLEPAKALKSESLRETFASLGRSRYLLAIAAMVLAYNIVLNLGELVWKDRLKAVSPDFNTYNIYLGYATAVIGVGSLSIAALFPKILGRFGWTTTAMICPAALIVTCGCFFATLYWGHLLPFDTESVLMIAVLFGGAMEVSGRMTKHSAFDSTKDMAFIPLDPQVKLRGKAAIDGAVSRIGRSGAAAVHQALIIIFASIANSIPAVALVLFICFSVWVIAVRSLGKQFGQLVDDQAVKEKAAAAEEAEALETSAAA